MSEEEAIILNGYLASEELANSANAISNMSNAIIHDYSFAWNPSNSYDSIGYLHNEMLDYYILNRNNSIIFTSLSDIVADFYNVASNFANLDSDVLRNNTDKYDICREIKILENEVNLSNIC